MSNLEMFHDAVFNGDLPSVMRYLERDPSLVRQQSTDGDTALHRACWAKQVRIIGVLLGYGAEVNAKGCYGWTPLHYSVHEGRAISIPIVETLIHSGADPRQMDNNGYTPTDWAKVEMEIGLSEVLKILEKPVDRDQERIRIVAALESLLSKKRPPE